MLKSKFKDFVSYIPAAYADTCKKAKKVPIYENRFLYCKKKKKKSDLRAKFEYNYASHFGKIIFKDGNRYFTQLALFRRLGTAVHS